MEKIVCLLLIALYGCSAAPAELEIRETPTLDNVTTVAIHLVANDGQFPFMVSIQQRFEPGQLGHTCGGTLISLQHVLTAASCLYQTTSGSPVLINPQFYRVFGGHRSLGNNMNDPDRVRMIENFTIHPDFVGNNQHLNDIAIITLDSPFVAGQYLQPLPLPEQDEQPSEQEGDCTICGWGKKTADTSLMQNSLTYAPKTVLNQTECIAEYYTKFNIPTAVDENMVCAASTRSLTYGCPGDEGGPLVCNKRLAGVLFTSVRCGISTDPLLYTRVSPYANWAKGVVGEPLSTSSSATFQPGVALVFMLAVKQFVATFSF
ncbi:anionic trypsin-like [Trichoplusia ni]|uniref:Anionic trypsin-like n=1 Tax=Trichoplusia ni TaxID=7111 RepID=A0A7E5W917_TRINI|nr:anionic trypsin-like [Trichoplusia ni]